MSALLAQQRENPGELDDDGIRRTLMGMLLGAVDTTATVVAHCTKVLFGNAGLRNSALKDVDDPNRFRGWCWEALRFYPHNDLLLRQSPAGTKIAGKEFKRDTIVVLDTLGAMHDSETFPVPKRADPERPLKSYLHFGGGSHPCAGRAVSDDGRFLSLAPVREPRCGVYERHDQPVPRRHDSYLGV